jgi:coenzyme PQQ biosynthesis protein PqqD
MSSLGDGCIVRLSRGARLRRDEVRGEDVLLGPDRGVRVNATAKLALEACDGRRTLEQVIDRVLASFRAPPPSAREEVRAFLVRLHELGLLEVVR